MLCHRKSNCKLFSIHKNKIAMKKLALGLLLASGLTVSAFQFATQSQQEHLVLGKICFKIKNDTGKSQTLHTGSGTKPINNLTTNEICMDEGSTLYLAERGSKGQELLKVTSSVSGKTFSLSDLMK